jgi:hypothetical protein
MQDAMHLHEHIARLREENEQLRQAAHFFGELAERLMRELDAERRRTVVKRSEAHTHRVEKRFAAPAWYSAQRAIKTL